MQLGFVSAILPDKNLEEVLDIASRIGYDCVEIMCWPPGKADRRYAGVTHIDITSLDKGTIQSIHDMTNKYGVSISALGYYPNPLTPDVEKQEFYTEHIIKMIQAASRLGIQRVNTFVGRDQNKTVEENWEQFKITWSKIIGQADSFDINIGIENCPMYFTKDEWPGGKNLAISPDIWRKMWKFLPSSRFGLNYDPSHLIIQHMDPLYPIRKFPERIHHVHAKDARIDLEKLNEHGVFSFPNLWHTPKLPGMGDVNWGAFFSVLTDSGYDGPVCVEVEDRAYEGSLKKRLASLQQSHDYLRQFIPVRTVLD